MRIAEAPKKVQTKGASCERSEGSLPHGPRVTKRGARLKLRAMAVVRSGSDAHAAKLILVVLLVQDVPLLAAFQDFLFLRSDSLAHFQFDFLFVLQRGRHYLHHMLANGVAVVHEFHFLAFDEHVRDLVRQAYDFFAGQAHRFWKSSYSLEFDSVKPT